MSLAYERIAKRFYKRAQLGIILRQMNADIEDPQPGDLINMPPLTDLLNQRIQPASHIFRKNVETRFMIIRITLSRIYARDYANSQRT